MRSGVVLADRIGARPRRSRAAHAVPRALEEAASSARGGAGRCRRGGARPRATILATPPCFRSRARLRPCPPGSPSGPSARSSDRSRSRPPPPPNRARGPSGRSRASSASRRRASSIRSGPRPARGRRAGPSPGARGRTSGCAASTCSSILSAGQFQVNTTYNLGIQDEPAICYGTTGNFLVAWSERNGYDGSGMGVWARVYGPNGSRCSASS